MSRRWLKSSRNVHDLLSLHPAARTEAIAALATNPRPPGCIKLTGRDGWHIRIGDFRVIYEINDSELLIAVVQVGNRRDIYRR